MTLTLVPLAGAKTSHGTAVTLPTRVPVAGTLPWLRCFYGDAFKRGALVRVNGQRGWITSAGGGFVNVALDGGGRAVVRPGEIEFPQS